MLLLKISATSNSDSSNAGDLKFKLRCCLYAGSEYFASSPFNPPTTTFVLKQNKELIILLTKKFNSGFNVLYEPSCEGVRSPWYTRVPAFIPSSNFDKKG